MNSRPKLNLVAMNGYCVAWLGQAGINGQINLQSAAETIGAHADLTATTVAWVSDGDRRHAGFPRLQTGRPIDLRDLANEPDTAPWVNTALSSGYRSMIALPIEADRTPLGSYSIFSAEADAFSEKDMAGFARVARKLASDIHPRRRPAARVSKGQARNMAEQGARKRMAATLHDVVGQCMQTLGLGLKQAQSMATRKDKVPAELLDQLIAEFGFAMDRLRDMGQALHSGHLERPPLVDAVRDYCSEVSTHAAVSIRVLADDADFDMDERVKEQCLLCLREALSNAARHAWADRIDVTLEIPTPNHMSLTIVDDGVGFDPRKAFKQSAGLARIQKSAEQVAGSARIHSSPGGGTVVRIVVPLARRVDRWP